MPHHCTSRHVIPPHAVYCHVMSCYMTSHHIMACQLKSCPPMPYRVTSCHMPCYVTTCHVMPYHAMPCGIPSHIKTHSTDYPYTDKTKVVTWQRQSQRTSFPTDVEASSTNNPWLASYVRRRIQRQANDALRVLPIKTKYWHRLPDEKNKQYEYIYTS